jgi:hypothetical protein
MKATIVFVIAMTLATATTLRADDKQTPDGDMTARIAAAEAKLKAKIAAATQPITTDDPAALRAIIQHQQQQIQAMKEQIAILTYKLSTKDSEAQPADGDPPSDAFVLSHRDYEALPKGSNGRPLGFYSLETGAVGWIQGSLAERVVDEKTAIVSILLVTNAYGQRGVLSGPDRPADLVIQGVSTAEVADNSGWILGSWFKVVGTTKIDGTTYFAAKQIVETDKAHPVTRSPSNLTGAPAQGQAANDSASKPRSSIPSIDGVWQEAPGILLTVTQDNGHFKAECSYARAGAGVIHWEMIGTVAADGDINSTLRHTVAPANWKLLQTRVGKLSADANTISGTATWDGGSGDFTWTRLVRAN